MERIQLKPRQGWQQQFEQLGFTYHSIDDLYWDERYAYRFTSDQIDHLESVTEELHQMALQAVGQVVREGSYEKFAIPEAFWKKIEDSWLAGEFSLYGRFDLSWNGSGEPKLLEYNADTPTGLVESSVAQWYWLQDVFPQHDQFNSLHEKLIAQWQKLSAGKPVHFAGISASEEDWGNLSYLRDTAMQAGLRTVQLDMADIGLNADTATFVDQDNQPIQRLFKLYPWEWMCREGFGPALLQTEMQCIEPAWKMLLSNKAILPLLWEMFPNHPNLLAASFDQWRISGDYVKKPLYSREGDNISLYQGSQILRTEGQYGAEGYVYQQLAPLPFYDDGITPAFACIGSWIVGDQAAGIGIREDATLITKDTSRFIPHFFTE